MNNSFSENQLTRLNSEEVKILELDILQFFASFCEDNAIKYWLDYGTLIGCIRHKGFIPWDDDIDVGMLREDYDRFVDLFNKGQGRYVFHSLETDGFKYVIGKCGEIWDTQTMLINRRRHGEDAKECVKIDVFPYDCIPEDQREFDRMKKRESLLFGIAALQNHSQEPKGTSIRRKAIKLLRILSKALPHTYYEKAKAIHHLYEGLDTSKYYCFANPYEAIMKKQWISDLIVMEFEGHLFSVPIGYDKWLEQNYGDYMRLPSKDKQVPHHSYDEAYYLGENRFI